MRFSELYDDVVDLTSKDAAEKYAFRKHVSRKWICFDLRKVGVYGDKEISEFQAKNQLDVLHVFRGLLLGMF